MPATLSLRGVGRTFGQHPVLASIDLHIKPGETVAVLGPSGSGKSTLLRLIAGLDSPTDGTVNLDGTPAVVFQDPRLMAWRSLASNVAFGLPKGTPGAVRSREVARALEVVGLKDFARHRPSEVSGGMAQRTALARALVRNPGVLLLDEPFAALDALTRLRMQDLLDEVQRRSGTTVLLVTHDIDEALRLADRVVVLGQGPAATITTTVDVPSPRPRARDDLDLLPLRTDLLRRLGVDSAPADKEPLR